MTEIKSLYYDNYDKTVEDGGECMQVTMKAARINANLSQTEAAKRLKIALKTLQNWEAGVTSPRVDKMPDICKLYGCTMEDIIFLHKKYD